MRPALRLALVVLGIAVAGYGTASLTGGWLGTPTWWEVERPATPEESKRDLGDWLLRVESNMARAHPAIGVERRSSASPAPLDSASFPPTYYGPRAGRKWISGGVVGVGLALTAFGAWPRRRRVDIAP